MATRQGQGIDATSNYIKNTLLPSITYIRSGNIYDNELTDLAGFPAATVTMQEIPSKVLDNSRNEHTYIFVIRLFVDRNKANFGGNKAEQILRQMIDQLLLQIDTDYSLGGNVIAVNPVGIKFGYIQRENDNIRLAEVTLECIDAITYR